MDFCGYSNQYYFKGEILKNVYKFIVYYTKN